MKLDAFVLAGGHSRRMGRDKTKVFLPNGTSLLAQVVQAIRPVSGRISIVRRASQDSLAFPEDVEPLPVVFDRGGEAAHPLWGLEASLRASTSEYALVVACDLPDLPTEFLRQLVEKACLNGVVAAAGEHVHPLVAVYPKVLADAARDGARSGISMQAFCRSCLRVQGQPEWFRNVNAPTDLPS